MQSYNALRINRDRDYRAMSLDKLLELVGIDQARFLEVAENVDTPEELTEFFTDEDQLYLIFFELWRRLLPEEITLSILCDELDYQIEAENDEAIQDLLAYLQDLLDSEADEGEDPKALFKEVASYCAHDLEVFLYDYIAEQIDDENDGYAAELTQAFSPYVEDENYFQLLQARLWARDDLEHAHHGLEVILEDLEEEPDLTLYLEILDFLSQGGDRDLFLDVAKKVLPLLTNEEEFVELLDLCIHYYRCLDHDKQEAAIDRLINARKSVAPTEPFTFDDPGVASLITIIQPG